MIRPIGILAGLAAAVIALQSAVLAFASSPQTVRVWFAHLTPGDLPDDVKIVDWQAHSAQLDGVSARAARILYARGALLILPVRRISCLTISA
jgi:hypothetical protein